MSDLATAWKKAATSYRKSAKANYRAVIEWSGLRDAERDRAYRAERALAAAQAEIAALRAENEQLREADKIVARFTSAFDLAYPFLTGEFSGGGNSKALARSLEHEFHTMLKDLVAPEPQGSSGGEG